jgi:hypothetical protein
MKKEYCAECSKTLKVSGGREECEDMCDSCYEQLTERVKFLSDRDNRMELVRAATMFASISHSKETRLRCFFASVMPEHPQHKVEKFLSANQLRDK